MTQEELEAPFNAFGAVTSAKLSKIQTIVASTLARNAAAIPHVTHHDEVDISAMEASRKARQATGSRVTPLAYIIHAIVDALKAYPRFNSALAEDGRTLVSRQYYHIGIAVDGPLGLLVPVIRDCDRKSLDEVAAAIVAVSEKARTKGLSVEEMSGGCFSVSSLGAIGGTGFTPIINAPEVAILGVARTQIRPVWDGNAFIPRPMLPLSLSYDHRVINGADAARFVRHIGDRLVGEG
jgi:pyruvate dehydrogenase E2 component (dihydrolipoamide acetyltransferase)